MQLVLITSSEADPGQLGMLEEMLQLGVSRVQVRWPQCSLERARALLAALPDQVRRKLVLHQHHELVGELGLLGCHWKSGTRSSGGAGVGFQTYSAHQPEELLAVRGDYESIFVSPLFPSISKQGYVPLVENWRLAEFREQEVRRPGRVRSRVCALGGVNVQNLAQCVAWGFEEAAVLGAVWESKDPLGRVAELCGEAARLLEGTP